MILPTSSAKTARKATIFHAGVLGVLFCQIGSASASCMTNFRCSTNGPNYDCSGTATNGGQQYCCCNNLGYMCSSSSYCSGGGSSFGEFSVYIKRLRNAPDEDSDPIPYIITDDSDPCIRIDGPNGVCGGTDTKWDNLNPDFYQRISCGCIDANGQKPKLQVLDNDDHPTGQCTAVQYAKKIGYANLVISSRSDDHTWDNGMSLSIEQTFDTTKCQSPSLRPPPPSPLPPPPPSPSPPSPISTNSMSTPTPGPTSCTPPPSWCNDNVSTCDTRSTLKHYECYNEPHYERNIHYEFRGAHNTH